MKRLEQRFEIKIWMEDRGPLEALQELRHAKIPLILSYPERTVNSVYYDTDQHQFFHEHLSGHFERKKIRLRWYGDMWNRNAQMRSEMKLKKGDITTKYTQDSFAFDPHGSFDIPSLQPLRPVLTNSFQRQYYIVPDLDIRVTLDYDICFDKVYCGYLFKSNPIPSQVRGTIVEIKSNVDGTPATVLKALLKKLPRSEKFSKYIYGAEALDLV